MSNSFLLWLGALRWAGEAVVRVSSLFRRKAWRRAGFFNWGGGCGRNVNRQSYFLGGRLGPETPGHLRYVHQTISMPGENMHVINLEKGPDWSL